MICPKCNSKRATRVCDSRERETYVYRKRVCDRCGYSFSTREVFYRETYGQRKPVTLSLKAMQNSWEAIWLEVKGMKPTPTIVTRVNERTVEFANGMIQAIPLLGVQWRVWDIRPDTNAIMSVPWLHNGL